LCTHANFYLDIPDTPSRSCDWFGEVIVISEIQAGVIVRNKLYVLLDVGVLIIRSAVGSVCRVEITDAHSVKGVVICQSNDCVGVRGGMRIDNVVCGRDFNSPMRVESEDSFEPGVEFVVSVDSSKDINVATLRHENIVRGNEQPGTFGRGES
jgi:hypothetical protein